MHLTAELAGCAGIDQNNEQVGAAAVDLVVEQLHGNSYGLPEIPKTVLIEGRWITGTTACGRSVVKNADVIKRAHPRFVENLRSLGAEVEWK